MIRKATPQDAKMVAPLIYAASGEILQTFLGDDFSKARALDLIEQLFLLDNVFISYQYTLVYTANSEVLGMAIAYPYHKIKLFDTTIANWLQHQHYAKTQVFSTSEANDDEFYIDSIAVAPEAQGRGIASQLFAAIEAEVQKSPLNKLSLIVDVNKTRARQIYTDKGFTITEIRQLYDKEYYHMCKEIN